jgi:hypothetical protein
VLTRVGRSPLLIASSALLALTLLPRDAAAIPPFARKYGVSCALCHQPVPRLTAFGETFASNGFEMAIGEDPRDTVGTGDPLLRLQRTFPVGVRLDAYQRLLSKKAAGEATVDQQVPWTVKVLSGGQIADKVSYYVYFLASERGEVGGLEDAYVQFTDIKGSGVSLLVGQFQVSDPLLKRELRLPYEDYQPYRVRVGDTRADLTYERGLMALWSPREGTDLALQVVNGQGLELANSSRQYDRDSDKAFSLRISQDAGPLRLGVFGYVGSEGAEGAKSRIRYFGPDATIALGANTEINLQLMRRWDSDPFLGSCSVLTPCPGGATAPFSSRVDAAIAELIYSPGGPGGRWFVSGLFNFVEADAPVVSLRLGEQDSADGFLTRYRTGAVGVHYLLKRNVRLMTEAGWNVDREQARLLTGFTLGF